MRRAVVGVAAGCLALLSAGSAQAQQAAATDSDDAMLCVYNALMGSEDYEVVAEVFLYDDTPEDYIQQAVQIIDRAKRSCTSKFKLTESQAASAGDIGMYLASADYLADELVIGGVADEAVSKVLTIYEDLTAEEVATVFDPAWRSDVAFSGKIRAAAIAAGLPDEDTAVDTVFAMIELSALADEAMYLFEQEASN